jgi:TPR repeat protein
MTGRALLLLAGLVAGAAAARAGINEDALAAYSRGDYAAALELWRPLAERGDPTAAFWLGACHDLGHGTVENNALAAQWYRKAAEQGHANAQHNLAHLYEVGELQAGNYGTVAAATWYRRAADQGYRPAQVNLGVLYFSGRGVKRDLVQAYKWFTLAGSDANRQYVAQRLSAPQREEAEALVRAWQPKSEP